LKFVVGDADDRAAADGLGEEIGVAGVGEAEFASGDGTVPGCDDEPIAGDVLEESEGIQPERGVKEEFGVIETQARLEMLVNDLGGDLLGLEGTLAAGLAE
jgi:hypothetical protein